MLELTDIIMYNRSVLFYNFAKSRSAVFREIERKRRPEAECTLANLRKYEGRQVDSDEGHWRSWLARFHGMEEVKGSNPLCSTINNP